MEVKVPIPLNGVSFYSFEGDYEFLNRKELKSIMEEVHEDLMAPCFKLFRDKNIMTVCFNQGVYNPESQELIYGASCNPIFYAHPLERRAVLGIPAYSRRMLNSFVRDYEEQGPLMITSSLEGFRGYVIERVEIKSGPGGT